jgi:uncharacterized protein YceK
MRYGILAVALAAAAYVFLCGCGTAVNLREGERKLYGGVRVDAQAAAKGLVYSVGGTVSPDGGPDGVPRDDLPGLEVLLGVVAWIDLPFTLVGDTLTLPWTVTAEVKRLVGSRDKPVK